MSFLADSTVHGWSPVFAATAKEKADACGADASNLCTWTLDVSHRTGVASFVDHFEPAIMIVFFVLVGVLLQRLVRRFIKRLVAGLQHDAVQRGISSIRRRTPKSLLNTTETTTVRRAQRAQTIGAILRSFSTVVIVVVTFFACIGQLSVDLGPFVAGTAIATAALGFGAQNIVRDFLAGFFIVVEDQYGVGDVIDIGTSSGVATSGVVEGVSLRTTQIRASDGTLWHVPNGSMTKVGNMSQTWSRAVVAFRVVLETDISHAIDVMNRVAEDLRVDSAYAGIITAEPEIWAPDEIDGDGILLKVALKVRPLEQWRVGRTLRSRVKSAFDAEGIRVATLLPERAQELSRTTGTGDDEA